jgi:Uma2 family endonuclease
MKSSVVYTRRVNRPALVTAEELLRLNLPNKRTELVDGQLFIREPAGPRHGEAAVRLAAAIVAFVYPRKLGRVFAAETGFWLHTNPDTVRAPDIAFVSIDRFPHVPERGFATMAPDLAVEMLSPDDRPRDVREKVAAWLTAGTSLVWVVDPVKRTARVYRADGTHSVVNVDGILDGESVLAGFTCELASIF